MAVAVYDASNSAKFSNVSGAQTVSLTVGSSSNRLLVLQVGRYDSALATLTSPVWDTDALTAVGNTTSGTARLDTYQLIAPKSGSFNAGVTLGDSDQGVVLSAISYSNVHQTTPLGTLRTNTGTTATTGWIGIDAVVDDLVQGAIIWDQGAASRTLTARNGIPIWIAVGTLTATATIATITATSAPAGRLIGDVEIATCRSEGAVTHAWTGTGWTQIGAQVQQGTNSTSSWARRIYDGSNADPVCSWTGNQDAMIGRNLFRDSKVSGTIVGTHGTAGTGTATPMTTTGANTTAADVLALLFCANGINSVVTADSVASFVERTDAGSATGPMRFQTSTKEVATSGTGTGNSSCARVNPVSWVAQQMQLFQATNGDQTSRQTQADAGSIASFAMATEVADVYNTLGWTMSVAGANFVLHGFAIKQFVAGPISGTADMVFGAGSSTLTGSGALAGIAAEVFGAGSSTLTGTGALAGVAAEVFGAGSTTLTGSGALAGVGAVTFTPTATLTGEVSTALAGSADVVFTGSATLLGSGVLAGAAAVTFTPQASLSGAGVLGGIAPVAFTPTGTFLGAGALGGVATVQIIPTATMVGSGVLAGSANVVLSADGVLAGYVLAVGECNVAFSNAGTLLGSGALAGVAAMQFTATATPEGGAPPVVQPIPTSLAGGSWMYRKRKASKDRERLLERIRDEEALRRLGERSGKTVETRSEDPLSTVDLDITDLREQILMALLQSSNTTNVSDLSDEEEDEIVLLAAHAVARIVARHMRQ